MRQFSISIIERQVNEFRQQVGLSSNEAINLRSLLLKLKVLTAFRPLSDKFSGMSIKSSDGDRFMLVNSHQPRGRQNFTIAHELYHLFIEDDPIPHNEAVANRKSESEKCADAFAQILLMPSSGVLQIIPEIELATKKISLATVIKAEQYFAVSRVAMLNRLFDLRYLGRPERESFLSLSVIRTARSYGYDAALYSPSDECLVLGDFGERARRLYDDGKISEGHYLELLSKIGIDGLDG